MNDAPNINIKLSRVAGNKIEPAVSNITVRKKSERGKLTASRTEKAKKAGDDLQ